MRARMVAWSLGLLSAVALAGCQSGYSLRNQPSPSAAPEIAKAPSPAPSTPAPSPAPAVPPATVAVIIEQDAPPAAPAAPPAPPLPPVRTATVAPPTIAAAPKLPPIVARNNDEPVKRTPPAPVLTESKAMPAQLATEQVFDIGSEPTPQPKLIPRTIPQASPTVVPATPSQRLSTVAAVEKITPAEVAPPRSVPSAKFNVVTGELQQWRKSWRLRYAPVDVEDEYGGCVILEGIPEGSNLHSGQHVRVQGALIPPSNRTDPARYAVRSFALLD